MSINTSLYSKHQLISPPTPLQLNFAEAQPESNSAKIQSSRAVKQAFQLSPIFNSLGILTLFSTIGMLSFLIFQEFVFGLFKLSMFDVMDQFSG